MSQDLDGFYYGPHSFQQLIPSLYTKALDYTESFLNPQKEDPVIDLYCGTGISIKRWLHRQAKVLGVELNRQSIEYAKLNTQSIPTTLLQGRCEDRIPQMKEWMINRPSPFLSVNPPRLGIETKVLDYIVDELRPKRMSYLSCSAGTLSRDLLKLEKSHFKIIKLIPFDFFPQTHHIEVLALISSTKN